MYAARDIDRALTDWKYERRRKPLLLLGVMGCGKTAAMRAFGKSFADFVELSLKKQPELRDVFKEAESAGNLLRQLELRLKHTPVPGRTLLFIDDLQCCPEALKGIRLLGEEQPGLHIAAAVSRLELQASSKDAEELAECLGRVKSLYMYPFSFKEFLRATGRKELSDYLEQLRIFKDENTRHSELTEAYREFMLVGGMPEAVMTYAATGSLLKCREVHRRILRAIGEELANLKPCPKREILKRVLDYAIASPCAKIRPSSALEGVSAYYFEQSIRALSAAGLLFTVKASSCNGLPFGAEERENGRKLLFFDSGVCLTARGDGGAEILAAKDCAALDAGGTARMQTGLELIKYSSPTSPSYLYYWYRSGALAETDYVVSVSRNIVPLAVRDSGRGGLQSLHSFMKCHDKSSFGIRMSLESFSHSKDVLIFPLYSVCRLSP